MGLVGGWRGRVRASVSGEGGRNSSSGVKGPGDDISELGCTNLSDTSF